MIFSCFLRISTMRSFTKSTSTFSRIVEVGISWFICSCSASSRSISSLVQNYKISTQSICAVHRECTFFIDFLADFCSYAERLRSAYLTLHSEIRDGHRASSTSPISFLRGCFVRCRSKSKEVFEIIKGKCRNEGLLRNRSMGSLVQTQPSFWM